MCTFISKWIIIISIVSIKCFAIFAAVGKRNGFFCNIELKLTRRRVTINTFQRDGVYLCRYYMHSINTQHNCGLAFGRNLYLVWVFTKPNYSNSIRCNIFRLTENMKSNRGMLWMADSVDSRADVVSAGGQVHVWYCVARASTWHVTTGCRANGLVPRDLWSWHARGITSETDTITCKYFNTLQYNKIKSNVFFCVELQYSNFDEVIWNYAIHSCDFVSFKPLKQLRHHSQIPCLPLHFLHK